MAIKLPDGRCESNQVLAAMRSRAVHARQLGYAVSDIAAILGVREETISRWCTRYDRGGQEALPGDRTGRPIGSGRLLDSEQEQGDVRWPFTGVVAVSRIEVSARASPFANGRPLVLQAMDLGSSPLRAARSAAPVLDFVTGVSLSGRPGPNGPCT